MVGVSISTKTSIEGCVTKFIKIHTAVTATKLSETKQMLIMFKEGINDTANTKGSTDGQTWRRLKRIAIVVFENMLA